jgi:hypothetical protein
MSNVALNLQTCVVNALALVFVNLPKADIGFAMYVRPSGAIEHLGSRWTDYRDIL